MKCQNCGAEIGNSKFCEYCGSQVTAEMIKEQEQVNKKCCSKCGSTNITYKREKQGEVKGKKANRSVYKTVGVCKDCGNTWFANDTASGNKKSHIWLWVLGWILIFPLPLTILMLRNKKLKLWIRIAIIIVGWLLYFVIFGSNNSSKSSTNVSESTSVSITELSFSKDDDIRVKIGKSQSGYIDFKTDKYGNVDANNIILVSDNPNVATITMDRASYSNIHYNVVGVGAGETEIYAKTSDETIVSEHVKVVVPEPIGISSIQLSSSELSGCLNQSFKITASYLPENAEDTTLNWESSDKSVATVNSSGIVHCCGDGTAIITVSSNNGVAATINVNVDGSKKLFNVKCSKSREDNVDIGSDWLYTNTINNERVSEIAIGIGDTLTFKSEYTESDKNPDIGRGSVTHTVTEEEFNNGFSVNYDVYVTENGGKYSGQSAHFVVTYDLTPSK